MDSDDDFMSGVSSEDDVLQDESENENVSGDGMSSCPQSDFDGYGV